MNITFRLTGGTPLLMHNPRMVDPEYAVNREMKALTSKRKKTDEDLLNIAKLEWYGGLYDEGGIVVQPTSKLRKCLVNTAKINKLGKSVERAISMTELFVPLIYEGPKDIDKLFETGNYVSRLSVGVSGKRVMRVRPEFYPWGLEIQAVFIEDAGLNFDDLERIAKLAGTVEGIGDNRVNGYGRFKTEILV